MKQITIPDWFKLLPDDARLNARDMANLFDYKNVKCLSEAVKRGHVPNASAPICKYYWRNKMWLVSDLKEHFKQLGATK